MLSKSSESRLALIYTLIAIGALCAALYSVLGVNRFEGRGAVAYVNGDPIAEAEYARAIKAMQAGIERPLTDDDKARALRVLINEELIVQEAIHLGLAQDDRLVRKNLVQAMINSDNVTDFLAALDGNSSFYDAADKAGFENSTLPALVPIGKVADLLGGEASETVTQMQKGDIAGPIKSGDDQIFLWLTHMIKGQSELDHVRDQVVAEAERRKMEDAFDDYVTRLRRRARIKTSPQL